MPPAVLTWQEEQTRFAFQNGQAVFMRNWPYAYGAAAGPVAVERGRPIRGHADARAPPADRPTATLGGSALAVNAYSDQPEAAYELIDYLLAARTDDRAGARRRPVPDPAGALRPPGRWPTRWPIPPGDALKIIERAVPRPVTPVYSELSEILQISLHRALTRQQPPREALQAAATAMRALLVQSQARAARAMKDRDRRPTRIHDRRARGAATRRVWRGRSRCLRLA